MGATSPKVELDTWESGLRRGRTMWEGKRGSSWCVGGKLGRRAFRRPRLVPLGGRNFVDHRTHRGAVEGPQSLQITVTDPSPPFILSTSNLYTHTHTHISSPISFKIDHARHHLLLFSYLYDDPYLSDLRLG